MAAGLALCGLDINFLSGFELFDCMSGLSTWLSLNRMDLVITGEGCLDGQTAQGKLPVCIAALARQYNLPVFAFAGCLGQGHEILYEKGIDAMFSLVNRPMTLVDGISNAEVLFSQCVQNALQAYFYGLTSQKR